MTHGFLQLLVMLGKRSTDQNHNIENLISCLFPQPIKNGYGLNNCVFRFSIGHIIGKTRSKAPDCNGIERGTRVLNDIELFHRAPPSKNLIQFGVGYEPKLMVKF
ncbi:MAG TPA: hypothetical protein DCS35_04820 [Vibrio sp.]|nr:hypothetical protein [Vibrio sp.]